MISKTRRAAASLTLAVVALGAFAGIASAAPSVSFQKFGPGDVAISGTGATLTNDANEYSGIYVKSKSLNNKQLADVHVSFNSTGDFAGGAPRFSIPLSTGVDVYAFLDVNDCSTSLVSTDDSTCRVFVNTGASYDNWRAFAAANPATRIAKDAIPFIIADQAGTYAISNVDIR